MKYFKILLCLALFCAIQGAQQFENTETKLDQVSDELKHKEEDKLETLDDTQISSDEEDKETDDQQLKNDENKKQEELSDPSAARRVCVRYAPICVHRQVCKGYGHKRHCLLKRFCRGRRCVRYRIVRPRRVCAAYRRRCTRRRVCKGYGPWRKCTSKVSCRKFCARYRLVYHDENTADEETEDLSDEKTEDSENELDDSEDENQDSVQELSDPSAARRVCVRYAPICVHRQVCKEYGHRRHCLLKRFCRGRRCIRYRTIIARRVCVVYRRRCTRSRVCRGHGHYRKCYNRVSCRRYCARYHYVFGDETEADEDPIDDTKDEQ